MTKSLVRASLELININDNIKKDKKKKKKSGDISNLIPANHRVSKKNKSGSIIFTHNRKLTVHEARKKLADKKDPTEDNIEKLLLLSNYSVDSDTAAKLFERAVKKRPVIEAEKPKEEEPTAFTEEDFAKFEAEFMG